MRCVATWLALAAASWSAPSPELPGIDIHDLGPAWGDTVVRRQGGDPRDSADPLIGSWQTRPPVQQLEADEVLLGLGEGAIFVPSMTHARLEPRVTVVDVHGKIAAMGSSGRRIRVPPGSYRVFFGSGSSDQRLSMVVDVVEGETAITAIPWAGLTITTISPDRQPFRGEYKLVREDRFQSYGEGYGQTDDRLSDLPTWILPPGLYKLTGLSAGTDDLTNFVTLRLLPGEWIEYTLVMDDTKVVGGGMIPRANGTRKKEGWLFGADLGGSVAWTREKLARQSNLRTTTNLTGYSQLRARRETGPWLTSLRLQFVGGGAKVANNNWRVTPDEITGQVFTVRRVTPRVGPYGRLVGASHAFPTDMDLSSDALPIRLYVRDPESGVLERKVPGGTAWESAPSFAPLELRQGFGLNVEAIQLPALELSLQGGLAARQVFPLGAYYQKSLANPALQAELSAIDSEANALNTIVMQQALFDHGIGFEATGDLRARLGSNASLTATPGMFWGLWPRDETEFSLTTVLSLHLTRFLSVDYRYTIKRTLDEAPLHRYPYSHQILMRFSFGA